MSLSEPQQSRPRAATVPSIWHRADSAARHNHQYTPLLTLRFYILLATFAGVYLVGLIMMAILERHNDSYDFITNVYFISSTVSLMGLGDVVPSTSAGRVWIGIYAVFAAGCMFSLTWTVAHHYMLALQHSIVKRCLISVSLIVTSTVGFAVLFMGMEGWSFIDSLYMCSNALGAIGYGNVAPITPVGKIIFSSLVGFVALPLYGSASYALADAWRTTVVGPLAVYLSRHCFSGLPCLSRAADIINSTQKDNTGGLLGQDQLLGDSSSPQTSTLSIQLDSKEAKTPSTVVDIPLDEDDHVLDGSLTAVNLTDSSYATLEVGAITAAQARKNSEDSDNTDDDDSLEDAITGITVRQIQWYKLAKKGAVFCLFILVIVTIPSILLSFVNGFDFQTAFWFVMTTITCVGYGNDTEGAATYFPEHDVGKIVSIVLTPFCVGSAIMFTTLFTQHMDRKDMSPKQGVIVSLIGLLVVVVYGFAVFIPLEPTWSFADTFYFILVTLSTIGYGDIVPNTGLTQLTTVPLLFGVYFFFLTVMSLATAFVNTVHQYIKSRKPTSYVNDEFETNTPMEQLELAVLPNASAAPQKITVVVEEETPPVAATAAVDPHNNSSLADIQIR